MTLARAVWRRFSYLNPGGRTGKRTDFEKAKVDQGDIDLKLMKDLNQGQK